MLIIITKIIFIVNLDSIHSNQLVIAFRYYLEDIIIITTVVIIIIAIKAMAYLA